MCTLSIRRDAAALTVTMNRDDAAQRAEAPPSLWPAREIAFAAPKDLQAGGAWIGVNAHGVIACLLNRYDAAPPGRASRGAIVVEAMGGRNLDHASAIVSLLEHRAYSPFTCMLIDKDRARRLDWTGSAFARMDISLDNDVMVTSSSWKFEQVSAQRAALFRSLRETESDAAARIAAFHCHRDSRRDTWAPMMRRPHAETKSVTQVTLTADGAEMRYWARDSAISRRLRDPDSIVAVPTPSPRTRPAPGLSS